MNRDQALDRLYSVPLGEFTAERDRLAKELRAAGDAEAAADVKARKKPSVVAWAVNQLVRATPDRIEELLRIRDGLLDTSDASRIRELGEERRRAISASRRDAARILDSHGHNASSQTLDKVALTLEAASTGDDQDIRSGRLTAELAPSGFDAVGLTSLGGDVEEEAGEAGPSAVDRRRIRKLFESATAASGRAEKLARTAEDLARKAQSAADDAAAARRRAQEAREEAEAAAIDAGLSPDDL